LFGWAHTPGRLFGLARLKHRRSGPEIPQKTQRALDFERNRIAVVMIRLARFGARKQPYYRIVAIEKDRARNGRSIEVVGTYNPRTNPATVDLKHERIAYWRSVGAQFSTIVEKLVAKNPATAAVAEPVEA
jgi:small subunit ribosomal protein S16